MLLCRCTTNPIQLPSKENNFPEEGKRLNSLKVGSTKVPGTGEEAKGARKGENMHAWGIYEAFPGTRFSSIKIR